jgi:hypothetical protein
MELWRPNNAHVVLRSGSIGRNARLVKLHILYQTQWVRRAWCLQTPDNKIENNCHGKKAQLDKGMSYQLMYRTKLPLVVWRQINTIPSTYVRFLFLESAIYDYNCLYRSSSNLSPCTCEFKHSLNTQSRVICGPSGKSTASSWEQRYSGRAKIPTISSLLYSIWHYIDYNKLIYLISYYIIISWGYIPDLLSNIHIIYILHFSIILDILGDLLEVLHETVICERGSVSDYRRIRSNTCGLLQYQ